MLQPSQHLRRYLTEPACFCLSVAVSNPVAETKVAGLESVSSSSVLLSISPLFPLTICASLHVSPFPVRTQEHRGRQQQQGAGGGLGGSFMEDGPQNLPTEGEGVEYEKLLLPQGEGAAMDQHFGKGEPYQVL